MFLPSVQMIFSPRVIDRSFRGRISRSEKFGSGVSRIHGNALRHLPMEGPQLFRGAADFVAREPPGPPFLLDRSD